MTDLSVIVPCYNTERFIPHLLDSLKRQVTNYEVEYIFVMNNCTDNTEQVVRDSGLDCTILQCYEKGCGPARNVGLEHAHGKWVWFMDSDDWLIGVNAINSVLSGAIANGNHPMQRIRFRSTFPGYFSMVWQFVFDREFIGTDRFPNFQPCEDDAFTQLQLAKLDLRPTEYVMLPLVSDEKLYNYYYMRDGSNMLRHYRGEKI